MKKGRSRDRPYRQVGGARAYSRLPTSCSSIMTMLMKFSYKLSAPMMPALASHSLSPWAAWATEVFLMFWVS